MKRVAIPVAEGKLCAHFGHCQVFAFVDVDENDNNKIVKTELIEPPPHEPGVLPPWVSKQGANLVLAGGMGGRAVQLFEQAGVKVITGCPSETPEELVCKYMDNVLEIGENTCGHDPNHECNDH